jgi:hypothetical protein
MSDERLLNFSLRDWQRLKTTSAAFTFDSHRVTVTMEFDYFFLLECERECTGERAPGQFSIFGAVEENLRKKILLVNRLGERV